MHCQDCRRPMPPKRESCMYCGGAAVEDAPSFQAPLCVSCKGTMKPHPDPEKPVLHCKHCNSLWFGRGVLEKLLAALEVELAETDELQSPLAPATRTPQAVEYRTCPSCDTPMKRENYRRISGIIIDTCQQHGTFLDAGELEALMAFIQAGGEAAADHQEQLEEQHIEETEKRSEKMMKELRNISRVKSSRFHWGGQAQFQALNPTADFTLWDMLTGSDKFFRPQ
jgi:Zn-finger nucleic acid-binding protein